MKKFLRLAFAGALLFSIVACSKSTGFTAGTYEGSAPGMNGDITVSVTLSTTEITKVEVTSHQETPGISDPAIAQVPAAIVAAQSTQVDTVSGATFSSNGIINAVNAALQSAGVNPSSLKPRAATAAGGTDQSSDMECDIVIVGAGGAGLVAALQAVDNGAENVVIVEKMPMTGGNSTRATGGMNAGKTPNQDENVFAEGAGVEATLRSAAANYSGNAAITQLAETVRAQYDAYLASPQGYFDSAELFMLDTLIGGYGINNVELVRTLAENSADAIAWLRERQGVDLSQVAQSGGASVKRTHRPVDENGRALPVGAYMIPILTANCEKNENIQILLETKATEIIMEDGAAKGIVATKGGNEFSIRADAVIIASGGFGANNAMVAQYKPEYDGYITTNAPGIDGDGIVMAESDGAAVVDMDQIQLHPTVHPDTSLLITEGLRGDGAILVNRNGERFIDEVKTRDVVSAAEFAQPGRIAWLVIDQAMADTSAVITGYINQGLAVSGETYEALAETIGIDPAAFADTMTKWNGYVAAGEDPDFGRVSFASPLDTPPYYAISVNPGIHHTMGGLQINSSAQALNASGQAIPGLFAAGEVTGGVHGANRLGGNAVADFVVFGRIAGASAQSYVSQ